jgi:hypothetical protein
LPGLKVTPVRKKKIVIKFKIIYKLNLRIGTAPTQPYHAGLGTEQNSRQATSMSAHKLLPLAVNSKSEQKVDSLLGLEPMTFGTQAYPSDRLAKSHPPFSLIVTDNTFFLFFFQKKWKISIEVGGWGSKGKEKAERQNVKTL